MNAKRKIRQNARNPSGGVGLAAVHSEGAAAIPGEGLRRFLAKACGDTYI
ncbi:MAG: hypothetical protein ACN6PV_27220 [Achromobacter sp.]|jgi:hypothetical protein